LSELDQELGVKRLRPIEQTVPDPDLLKQLSHLRQGAVGCVVVAGGELDESEHAQ
jgi:hypothetical protein